MARKVLAVCFLITGVSCLATGERSSENLCCALVFGFLGLMLLLWPRYRDSRASEASTARKIIAWGCFAMVGVGGLAVLLESGAPGEALAPMIVFLVLGLWIQPKSKLREEQVQRKKAQKRVQAEIYRQRRLKVLRGDHITGLPLPQGVDCSLCFDERRLTISGGGQEFRLAYDKIVNIELHTDVDIQKSYVSSVGGAIGGYMLFGELGAMVGGRAKERTSTVEEYYALVTYLKDGTSAGLSFRTKDGALAQEIINEHRGKWCRTASRMKPMEL